MAAAAPSVGKKRKAPEPKAKKVSLEKRLQTLPHQQLVDVLIQFLRSTNQEDAFVSTLPEVDVSELLKSLSQASSAIV